MAASRSDWASKIKKYLVAAIAALALGGSAMPNFPALLQQ
jgi:hypothetical protein